MASATRPLPSYTRHGVTSLSHALSDWPHVTYQFCEVRSDWFFTIPRLFLSVSGIVVGWTAVCVLSEQCERGAVWGMRLCVSMITKFRTIM